MIANKPILNTDHISICICTFERVKLLSEALTGTTMQDTDPGFTFEVIVVDNDCHRSAEETVLLFQPGNATGIVYDCEPEQNIALARNRAIANAKGDFIAFIDDDEVPVRDWLLKLYNAIKEYKADGVLGPVLPSFPSDAPKWLKKGNIFDRRRFNTGTRLTESKNTRTGNVLLSQCIFSEETLWFDPVFGLTGGEDVDFFRRQLNKGRVFVWCDEAVAYETIPPERCKKNFHIKKFIRLGTLNGEHIKINKISGLTSLMKTIISIPIWLIVFFILIPFGKHIWFRFFLKFIYASSCIFSYCGLSLVRYRD